jgi:hypothetical protein
VRMYMRECEYIIISRGNMPQEEGMKFDTRHCTMVGTLLYYI